MQFWSESVQCEFDFKSQVWFQTKITIATLKLQKFSHYQDFVDLAAGVLKSRKDLFISFCIMMKWCSLEQTWFRANNSVICE